MPSPSLTLRPALGALLLALASSPALAQTQDTTYRYEYDAVGNRTQVTDPLGRITRHGYDAFNRLVLATDAAGGMTRYGYDGLDQLIAVTDPRNLVTAYTIDGLGNQTALASPDTGTSTRTVDIAGNVITSTDARGQTTRYQVDVLSRITRITYADGQQVTYAYDQGNNALGRLTQVSDAAGTIAWAYGPTGKASSETRTINDIAYVTSYGYDAAGRLERVTYPSGRILTYARDAMGRISAIASSRDGASIPVVSQVTHEPFGGIRSYVNGAGKTVVRSRDLDGRITSHTLGNGVQTIAWDAASRITAIGNGVNPAASHQYGYDRLDRLTQDIGALTRSFDYDPTGNRTSHDIGATRFGATIEASSNRLLQVSAPGSNTTYGYDANGSRTSDATRQYGYDARGRLVTAVTAAGTVQYRINALGQRVQKSASGSSTVYHYDGQGQLIGESTAQGVFGKEYVYLHDMPVALFQ
jgi:YD repeat-containing protein